MAQALFNQDKVNDFSCKEIQTAVNQLLEVELTAFLKAEFPSEQSLDTFIGIQAMSYNDRYFNRIHKGFGQVQDTLESYFDQQKN